MAFPRSSLKHQLWSSRAVLFVLPFLFGSGSVHPGWFSQDKAQLQIASQPKGLRPTELTVIPPHLTIQAFPDGRATEQPVLPQPQTTPTLPSLALATESNQPRQQPISTEQLPAIPLWAAIALRVAIAREASTLTLGASAPTVVLAPQGQLIDTLDAGSAETAQPHGSSMMFGGLPAPSVLWVKPKSKKGLIQVNGRWYRGAIQLIARNQSLFAINHLDIESYLPSVVGAEMPAFWPAEALKAQAIAARSYALAHMAKPASAIYDLGNTQRWQAYRGVTTETNTTQAAVQETRGVVLSHQGSVVESLYAASRDIVQDVHKGYGMSQHGANIMAQQGYNYQQILSRYYPGTQLARLQTTQ